MDLKEITKLPVVDLKAEPKPESQVERVKRELQYQTDPLFLQSYALRKAEEFEKLRAHYERQLSELKFELGRVGQLADSNTFKAAQAGRVARDGEWLSGLKVITDLQVAITNGLVDIPKTVGLLMERLNAVRQEAEG